jgi:hypothetical protein
MTERLAQTGTALSRRSVLTGAVLPFALPLGLVSAMSARAHHGWGTFDTGKAYFVSGPLSSVHWGNPHGRAVLGIERIALPADWRSRPLPQGANERNGRLTIASARPYEGPHRELHLVLAGPEWMARWGLDRPLQVGERIDVVGFLDGRGTQAFRPAMFWLSDGQGVWQQLTSCPRDPEPVP